MVYRVYVEKKKELANEAAALLSEIRGFLGISSVKDIRIINRYDAENLPSELFEYAKRTVFAEPQLDIVSDELDAGGCAVFAVEALPGQFDQRADSAAQCIQIISQGERPDVKYAKVYAVEGELSEEELDSIKKHVINPVESRLASLELPCSLKTEYPVPAPVAVIDGFRAMDEAALGDFLRANGLAMDMADLCFVQSYFKEEGRDPSITEIKVIDTYWSDHCRHTTFNTVIDGISFDDDILQKAYERYVAVRKDLGRTKPVSLMDIGTIAAKALKKAGKLDKLDESDEINACTVKIDIEVDGRKEPWLLLFKNETHNHPTEIEPFGGAATCIGGAIRDPLSGRSYVYSAMRITGAADPLTPLSETIKGKLPQRKIVQTAAAGYSSYGNQIGLATGLVDEIYHPGYAAKHMELGAVIAAAPAANVRREVPQPGDIVMLIGGSTGRDGIGGATGSSKAHDSHSVENCGAEVQKGNAPEERKLQRFFRNAEVSRMIKRCNDFGAGGVSVAIGELADGLSVDLNAVPKKYDGLDGTELAISESQERMAVVIEKDNIERFLKLAEEENLQAVKVADVTEEKRLVLSWNGQKVVDISRAFLDTNGAEKHISVETAPAALKREHVSGTFKENYLRIASDLNICSKRGLSERFDSTIGAGTVLMPFGGIAQRTPIQAMVNKISIEKGHTDACSVMSWGFDPYVSEQSPFHGAYLAVVSSVCKLIASGADFSDVYLSFQEFFEKLGRDPRRWGKPLSAVLGAFEAQMDLGVAAIGGKDSMSGSFEDIDVPPTLISFAVTDQKTGDIISPEFKEAGNKLILIAPETDGRGLPKADSLKKNFEKVTSLIRSGKALSCYTPGMGGIAEAVLKMCMGNGLGFIFNEDMTMEEIFSLCYGSFLLEVPMDCPEGRCVGMITRKPLVCFCDENVTLCALEKAYESKLESVYSCNIPGGGSAKNLIFKGTGAAHAPAAIARPKVIIPVFPGTNCEYDSAKAFEDAGAEAKIMVINNMSAEGIARSVDEFAKALGEAQMVFIPGGFSGGDEPDGSAKFITAFFRNEAVKQATGALLDERGGLMAGICNGFQALIKLGLVPYGKIIDTDESCPTLTFNTIARHQSKIVRTRVASKLTPWLAEAELGGVYSVPISHGEGRFYASDELIKELAEKGQICTQYVDLGGNASMDIQFNPNGSAFAVEGICSPDGRVFGKMGHAERWDSGLYKNVPGDYDIGMFRSAVRFFK